MPWAPIDMKHQRMLFVDEVRRGVLSTSKLCDLFGISRKTGYKWLGRSTEGGRSALADRSRRPHSNSRAMSEEFGARVLELRGQHPTWGPRKLLGWLENNEERWDLPASSTVGELLKREGLAQKRPRRPRVPTRTAPLAHATHPNAVWTIDFKGDFRLGDGSRCYPLTLTDAYSRFLLCCRGFERISLLETQRHLERTFRCYGLPDYLRSDNGQPFGTMRMGPLSKLSAWLVKLGIRPEYIAPSSPQQNGRHERFHRTLKAETAAPPAPTRRAQQRRFDIFATEYNFDRPHEALDQLVPGNAYLPSPRQFPRRITDPDYPPNYLRRRVDVRGDINLEGMKAYVAEALREEVVGLVEIDDDLWEIWFGPLLLGRLHRARPRLGVVRHKVSPMSPV